MFLMIGVMPETDQADLRDVCPCPVCGRFGSTMVYRSATSLRLFLIPVYKWGKKYYAKRSCCGAVTELPEVIGKGVFDGTISHIEDDYFEGAQKRDVCPNCGYRLSDEFEYCPKCGTRL